MHATRRLALLTLALLAGCTGHGHYTSEGLAKARERVAGLKAGNEYQQARQAFLAGDLDKARKAIDRCLTINPSVPAAHILHGRILLEQSDLEPAAQAFLKAESLDPRNPEAQYYLGVLYERVARPHEALTRYLRAVDLEPSNPQHVVAAAEVMIDLGRLDDAEHFLTEHTTTFTLNAGVVQTLGHIAMLRGQPQRACELFHQARLLAPDDVGVIEDLICAQMASGRFADAEFNLARLRTSPPHASRRDLKYFHARCLLALDRPLEARDLLLELTGDSTGPADIETWIMLGQTSWLLRDTTRARQAAATIISLAPDRPEGYLLRALCQRRAGDFPAALRSADQAVERRGAAVEPLLLRGMILCDLGRFESARHDFAQVLAQDPASEAARQALAAVANP